MDRPPKPAAPPAPPLPDLGRGRAAVPKTRAQPARAVPTPVPPPLAPARDPEEERDTFTQELSLASAEAFEPEPRAPRAPRSDPAPPASAPSPSGPVPSDPARSDPASDASPQSGRASLTRAPALMRYGRYELLGRIAFGGMAEIFLARELAESGARAGRFVVVKRVLPHVAEDPHFVEMFVDEARLAMHLNHPNICHVYAYGEEQGSYYIAMEWVDGMPLSKLVRRARERGGVPIAYALKIVAQVAEALDHAHRACDEHGEPLGIVHRDVSPQNLMVAYDGPVKLLDFGIAKASSHSTRTEAGVVKGKFAYMSPQQCLGEPIDARADVFALGLCLYEILAGRNPFKRQSEFDTMRAIVYEDAPPLTDSLAAREPRPEIVAAVEQVIARATAKRPEDRFQSAAEMQLALEQVIARMGAVVTAARIGELMHELFDAEIKAGPQLDARSSLPPPASRALRSGASGEDEISKKEPPPPGATQRIDVAPERATELERPSSVVPAKRSALAMVAIAAALFLFGVTGAIGAWVAYTMGTLEAQTDVVTLPTATGAPAGASTGAIYVDSTPTGAAIEIEGRGAVGATPMEIGLLPPGTYLVRLRAPGHAEWQRSIELRPGERAHVVADLAAEGSSSAIAASGSDGETPRVASERARRDRDRDRHRAEATGDERPTAGPRGRLSINSRPWSKVYVGSRLLGTTPIGDVEVESGSVRLRFVDRDGAEHVRTITVPPGGHAREFFDLRDGAGSE